MPTQLEDLQSMPLQMLREMRVNPGAYSRALISRTLAEREAREPAPARVISMDRAARPAGVEMQWAQWRQPQAEEAPPMPAPDRGAPSQFREDYEGMKRSLRPVVRGISDWWSRENSQAERAAALQKRISQLPGVSALGYFTAPAPERQQSRAVLDFYNKNRSLLERDPDEFNAFMADPSGYVQMKSRVLTPREKGEQLAPTVEANGAEAPDAGPESIPAPYLPPIQTAQLPPGFTMGPAAGSEPPPWLRPKAPAGGAVGEGGSTAGGRPVMAPPVAAPPQNPAMAAIAAGQQAAADTASPGEAPAAVQEAASAMSPELAKATQDYLKLLDADGDTDQQDRYLSLAKAGFAMAGSGSPYLLQAVGQGGVAGLDAYQAARARAAERRLRQAQGRLEVGKIGEETRRAGVAETQRAQQIAETGRSNRAQESDRATARDLQREELDIRREGQKIQQEYYGRADYNILGHDEEGNAVIFDQRSGKTKTLTGVKPTGRSGAGDVEKALEVRQRIVNEMYPNLSREERADIVFGRSIPSATELRLKAREMAQKEMGNAADYRVSPGGKDKPPYDVEIKRRTEEIMGYLSGRGPVAAAPASPAAAPAARSAGPAVIRYDAQGNRLP